MSGVPICALTAPSPNCTIEWITERGWMTTSICSGRSPNSQRASITSKPLFISEAESIVTFAPMHQLGWFNASSTLTRSSSSAGRCRNGPPDAVRITFSTAECSPVRHWKMAECSESTGMIGARCSADSLVTISPATTRHSLLASATFLPCFSALTVGNSPL